MKQFETVGQMTLAVLTAGQIVSTKGYTAAGDKGAAMYLIAPAQTVNGVSDHALAGGTVALLQDDGLLNIRHFGAVGDGVADDTVALQTALDLGTAFTVPVGEYRVTSSLTWSHGSKMTGQGNWSGVASTFKTQGNSTIRYDGVAGGNTAVCILSDEPVGIDPTVAGDRDMQNIGLNNVVIDGNGKAGIGVYMVRAFSNNNLDFITVTNTTSHGFLAMKCWNGSIRNWMAVQNKGNGITLGQNLYGWDSALVDQSHFDSIFGYYSGYSSGSYLNQFNETTNVVAEYGIGVFGGRGLTFTNAQGLQCGGMGLYISPGGEPVLFNGGYFEINGRSSGSTKSWDIWFFGQSGGGSWDTTFNHIHLGTGQGKDSAVRLTGTEPSREEAGVIFNRMQLLMNVEADWTNYRLIDCNRNVAYTDDVAIGVNPPNGFVSSINGSLDLNIVGVATFNAGGGAIGAIKFQGNILDVVYTAVGVYDVTIERAADTRYGITVSGDSNRIAAALGTSITTTSFRVENRTTAGVLTDGNSRITLMITSDFD